MSDIQIIGFPQSPAPTAASPGTRGETPAARGEGMTAAAIASLVDRLGGEVRDPTPAPDPQLQAAMTKINQSMNFRVEMEAAEGTGLPVITIRDRATGEIIRQIPPKLFVAAARQIDSTRGFLFEKVA